jgi:hypothetical protein
MSRLHPYRLYPCYRRLFHRPLYRPRKEVLKSQNPGREQTAPVYARLPEAIVLHRFCLLQALQLWIDRLLALV